MTRKKKKSRYIDDNLDDEEKDMFDRLASGELKPMPRKQFLREKAMLQAAARNYFKAKQAKNGRVTIRMPLPVIDALKNFACEDGLPYQTLINSLLYKYVVSRSRHNS